MAVSRGQQVFQSFDGRISFVSDAPLEVIRASSDQLRGALGMEERTFAFTVEVASFDGFNSPLQRQHFNENYMESKKFPKAIFTGKVIEQIDFEQPGTYQVRAKGMLNIHGEEKERIIRSELTIHEDGSLSITAAFSVPLKDHSIRIPKIVYQKIAEAIQVNVSIQLEKEGKE
jgi:polyisoprenoid-binding protein YceI